MPSASSPFSSIFSRAFRAERRSSFSASSASCANGFQPPLWQFQAGAPPFPVCLRFGKLFRHGFQRMVNTGNVAERVRADLKVMGKLPFKFITNLWLNGSKRHRHLKPGILPDCGRHIDGFHLPAHLHKGSPRFFLSV